MVRTLALASLLACSVVLTADGATKGNEKAKADLAACQSEANAKFPGVHFIKRKNYINRCMAQRANR